MSKRSLSARFVMHKHDGKEFLHDLETGQEVESEEGVVPPTALLLFNALAADLAEIREQLDTRAQSLDSPACDGPEEDAAFRITPKGRKIMERMRAENLSFEEAVKRFEDEGA